MEEGPDIEFEREEEESIEDERFVLTKVNEGFKIEDKLPNLSISTNSFWDTMSRLRIKQLEEGSNSHFSENEIKGFNNYHIVMLEFSDNKIQKRFNGSNYNKKLSMKVIVSLGQDEDYLVITQMDGPPLYKNDVIGNRFLCVNLLVKRQQQLAGDIDPVSNIVYRDGSEKWRWIDSSFKGNPTRVSDIAQNEMNKGIYVNGIFITKDELRC